MAVFRFVAISFLITCLAGGAVAQSASSTTNNSSITPETGFVSPLKYTNAFFGFSIQLPQGVPFHDLFTPSHGSSDHFLFGLQAQSNDLTAMIVTAKKAVSASADEAKKAAAGPEGKTVKGIQISGREFWKSESQQKMPAGKMRNVSFASAVNGYVLLINIVSFDAKLANELEHNIEAIAFFDPTRAAEEAGADSHPYHPVAFHSVSSSSQINQLNPGTVSGNTYTNDALGFVYQFPAGWVVNDKATQQKTAEIGHQIIWGNDPAAAREHEAFLQCGRILLFVTKYPEGTKTEELNPLILVLATDSACFPGAHFPTSVNDSADIKEVARQFVRSLAGTPFAPKGQGSVNAFMVQGHVMLDISGSFTVNYPGHNGPLDIFTALDVTQAKDYWLAWAFMSGSQAGLQELRNTKIQFSRPQ